MVILRDTSLIFEDQYSETHSSLVFRPSHVTALSYFLAQVAAANGFQGSARPNGEFSVILNLQAGQTVWIEPDSTIFLYGSNPAGYMYSWFSTHLLHAA